jgi:DNA-binding CsgD family transcriptional regulator
MKGSAMPGSSPAPTPEITPAEARVLVLLLERLTPRQAASALGSSLGTVRTHIKHLEAKSGTHAIAALVLWGRDELAAGRVTAALSGDPRWLQRARRILTK